MDRRPTTGCRSSAVPAWTLDETTGQYYHHGFLPQQPDLNWRNPRCQGGNARCAPLLARRGVDGFRFDVAHHIMKDPEFRIIPCGRGGRHASPDRRFRFPNPCHDRLHADLHPTYREIRAVIDSLARRDTASLHDRRDARLRPRTMGLDSSVSTSTRCTFRPTSACSRRIGTAKIRAHVDPIEAALPADAWPNYVLSNHDDPGAPQPGLARRRAQSP